MKRLVMHCINQSLFLFLVVVALSMCVSGGDEVTVLNLCSSHSHFLINSNE
jgi:hypothetical protein